MLTLNSPRSDADLLVMGLDGEMSDNLEDGGRLIQAGYATVTAAGRTEVFSELISWPQMSWSDRAAQVHRLTREQVDAAPRAEVIDAAGRDWMLRHGATDGRRLVLSVGFNVAGWDHPFFRESLPQTMGLLSRRTIDLNAVCFTLDGWDPNPRSTGRDHVGWKRSAKSAATRALHAAGVTGAEHDAGYDAALALHAWLFLRDQIHTARSASRYEAGDGQDPALVAVFGAGLLRRLEGVARTDLEALAAAFGPERPAGKALGRRYTELAGRTGLQAVLDGDTDQLLAALP